MIILFTKCALKIMMNPIVKEKWLEALRSEEYSQTASCLKDDKGYCCLGVLSDLFVKETKTLEWKTSEDPVTGAMHWHMGDETAILPIEVAEWAGLECCDPYIQQGDDLIYLSRLNDDGASFAEISDVIQNNF